ncbi:sensor histidine kinase YesM [Luteibacter sp. Sphag1AF]|uniref:sensor histidine kinase n=1 Tax=Luteibacter sp. Sphag1AF TaxID=2587031 RepID=UPI001620FBE6|nr:histidine kinase [Luteibacter sp. Sphag1AF]MBB3228128.1 sensor histidine kinase YesM [Luteibacter sp. Sphag1AF]
MLYQNFRAFTWPWLLRRGMVLWPLAILVGGAYAAWHASGMDAWGDWPGLAIRACVATLLVVSVGPLLATWIRCWQLPLVVERVLVLLAILLGLWIGIIALDWASAYHALLMQAYAGRSMGPNVLGQTISDLLALTINAPVLVLIVAGGGFAAIYYLGERRRVAQYTARRQIESLRAERDAADMRLAVLQAQIEPHFLFNTLASVRSLIAVEPHRAARTIEALADYLRIALPRIRTAGIEKATLGRQIDLCLGYLEIMNVRTAGRIDVRVDAGEDVRALPFPPLILLALVENAVTHGIESKPGPGMIAITARTVDGFLNVNIEDDGLGLQPGTTPGVGLANVRAQLRDRFGACARFDIVSRAGGGVSARIHIPLVLP